MIVSVPFTSASTAGIVHVELGFTPRFAILVSNYGGTNPNLYFWADQWTDALSLLLTGSTGVVTRDTTGIDQYAGNETIAAAETVNSSPKHVDLLGVAAGAGHITAGGLSIPADHQANSGTNLLIAFRGEV